MRMLLPGPPVHELSGRLINYRGKNGSRAIGDRAANTTLFYTEARQEARMRSDASLIGGEFRELGVEGRGGGHDPDCAEVLPVAEKVRR